MWTREESFYDTIERAWNGDNDTLININICAARLNSWSRDTFGRFFKEIQQCRERMGALMKEEPSELVNNQIRDTDMRMEELEKSEELYWHQRSKQQWIEAGGGNTKFFHEKAHQRRQ